jgi:hypothetical protein
MPASLAGTSNGNCGPRLASRMRSPGCPDPSGARSRKISGWMVPKTEMLGPGNPVSAGPACVTADFRTNPTNIAAIPNGIARTPTRTNTPPLVPTLQQQRTSPDAGEESMSIAARIVRTDLGGVVRAYRSARRQPRGTEVARPRRRTHCGRLWGAYCCCNQCPEPEVRVLTCRECWRTSDRTTRPL